MKKILLLFSLLTTITTNLHSRGVYQYLKIENPTTIESKISGLSFISVKSAEENVVFESPYFEFKNEETKTLTIKGLNENGLVEIATYKYENENSSFFSIAYVGRNLSTSPGIYLKNKIEGLNYYHNLDINVDFDYLLCIHDKETFYLVNERGDIILQLDNYPNIIYYEDLFCIIIKTDTSTKIINLVDLLKSYSTSVNNAKASDSVASSKSYNIQGMETDDNTTGIVIENGKKYVK